MKDLLYRNILPLLLCLRSTSNTFAFVVSPKNNNRIISCHVTPATSSSSLLFATEPALTNTNENKNNKQPKPAGGNLESTTTEQYNNLLTWLNDTDTFPNAFVSPSVKLKPSSSGAGHGVFASQSLKEGELLFLIPREACISSQNVLNDEESGKTFQDIVDKAGPGGFTVCLAGFLAKEYLLWKENNKTNNNKKSSSSASKKIDYSPYFQTLPWTRGKNGQEHVLFWSEEDVENYLPESFCYQECLDLRAEVDFASQVLNGVIGPSIVEARGEVEEEEPPLIPFLSWTKPPKKPLEPVRGLKEAVTGAFVLLLTRAFNDDYDTEILTEDAEYLIPLLDLLNHSKEPTITYQINSENGDVEVRARRDVVEGEELFNRYREEEEEKMPAHRFFSRFGFVPGEECRDIIDLLEDKKSLLFAKRQEV